MIQRNHKPTPLVLSDAQIQSLRSNPKGLGDRVEKIAQPIARVIDRVAGTNIQECGSCKKRKEWLNKHFPNTLTNMIQ
jgi:hypothetical protein